MCPEGSLSGGSVSKGVSVQESSVQGGLCPGVSLSRGLCRGSLYPGGLCPGGSLFRGLCLGDISFQGSLSGGVSIQWESL